MIERKSQYFLKGRLILENTTFINTQKYYLFLREIKYLHEMDYAVVTNADLEKRLVKNFKLWKNLKKQRKVSDTRALIDGTLSTLTEKNYLKRVEKGKYRILDEGIHYLNQLQEVLIGEFYFEFTFINKELSEKEAFDAIVVNKQFEYSIANHPILTEDDIAELALMDYQFHNRKLSI